MDTNRSGVGSAEFICLMAVMMSLVALSIDAVLPALGQMGDSLGVVDANNTQLIIFVFFIGLSIGQMIYGPISDSYGRKKAVYLGISIFIVGNLVSIVSTDFTALLAGRALQGLGSACCRVVSIAMIRDRLEGREMARVMSLIMVLFILVPALAPSIGQLALFVSGWRAIFVLTLIIGVVSTAWLYLRQAETLPVEKRRPFKGAVIVAGIAETCNHRITRSYMLAAGVIFGAFVGYLGSAQQILQVQYELGEAFSLYFGALAIAIGVSSFATSKLVVRIGMEKLSLMALLLLAAGSFCFFLYAWFIGGHPNLAVFMSYLTMTFFSFGVLFSTFNTMALQPMGHIAGIATSVISSIQTLLSVAVGYVIGQCYDGTVLPLVLGFLVCGLFSLGLTVYVRRFAGGSAELDQ